MAGTMRTGRVYVDNQIPVANDELASKYYADQIASA